MEADSQIAPEGLDPLLGQANLARMRSQYSEAAEMCVRVLRSQPGNADAHSLLGDIYRDQGAVDDAIQWYRMATDIRPNGPDARKLAKLEAERERRAAESGVLNPSMALAPSEGHSGGTTQLMGYSPKRWLNTLTIVSTCFLAAAILVLVALRMNPAGRSNSLPRTMDLSYHVSMPTAETGVTLPSVNPNRPTILPLGEQSRQPVRIHQTGDGLEPDKSATSRTTPLPTFAPQTPSQPAATPSPNARGSRELPPAPVQTVRPLGSAAPVAPEDRTEQPARARTLGTSSQPDERTAAGNGDSGRLPGTAKPAPETSAGDANQNAGSTPPER